MAKRATSQTIIGVKGIAMISAVVGAMEHVWREHPGATDFGIDGDIELRDPGSGTVRNVRIGVQSRATTRKWPGETDESFFYTPKQDELDYWLSSNQPVILVCSRPATSEIYWRSVHDWARDPTRRAQRRIHFEKTRDRFDAAARDALFALRSSSDESVEPPSPAHEPEGVLLNLMPIIWKTGKLFSAKVPGADPRTLFAPAHEGKVHDFSTVLRDGYVWSLAPFREGFLDAIGADQLTQGSLAPWLESREPSDQNLVRDLVRRRIVSAHHRWISWNPHRRIAYFRLKAKPEEFRPVHYRWAAKVGRSVVAPQVAKTREGHTGYRHDATELTVRRLNELWYVEVHPTYVFTWDGERLSRHHASALKKIKEIETHPAVSQALRMWAHLLAEKMTLEGDEEPLALGELVAVSSPRSFVDATWREVSATELGYRDPDALALFDPDALDA